MKEISGHVRRRRKRVFSLRVEYAPPRGYGAPKLKHVPVVQSHPQFWGERQPASLPQIGDTLSIDLMLNLCAGARRALQLGALAVPARSYAVLAATVFAVVAVLQFVRALNGWTVVIGSTDIPVGASWVACSAALLLAVLGYLAALRE
jgi:hypothetical protein